MKRKLGWFGLGFAGAELAAAILPPLVCVPAAAFLVCLALLWIKRRRDSAIPVLGALCGLAWFLVFTLVWIRPVKALAGQTVTCTAVVETDADASYSESRLRGTLRLTEIDGRAANVKVQCASFPGESAGERFTAKFALTELPDNKYRLSRQSKGVYLQAEYLGSYHPLDASRAPRFALYRLRQRWSATLRRWLPRQLDGIEAAMLLADKSRLDDSVQQAFRTAGVSHLLAVSGLHLALLCGLLGFGRKWKFYKPLILLRAAAALFYLLLTGMPVSVSRAGIVLLVALVVNPLLVWWKIRRNPFPLVLLCLRESGVYAFFTRSSAANIPVNMALCEKLNLDRDTYSVSIPLGATINMAGAAITITVLTLAAVNTLGIPVDLPTALLLSVVASLCACGASGVAGGSLLLIPLACNMFGISNDIAMQVVAVGFIIGVLQDSCETALNSSTDVLFTAAACQAEDDRLANSALRN